MKPHAMLRKIVLRFPFIALTVVTTLLASLALTALAVPWQRANAAFVDGGAAGDVIIGKDNDNTSNTVIQPPGTVANQSLNNTDILRGGPGNDILIGLLGNDILDGGPGHDILIGGTEQGQTPNSDIIFGGPGDDISIWAPGDGSDAFIGGPGRDALVFGVIDRDAANVPTLTGTAPGYLHGVPTANVTGSPGFCTIERVTDPTLGYEFLARFFVRATGALAVTIRTVEVEQVFCTSTAGGSVTFADLTQPNPAFVEVSLDQVQHLNSTVRQIIR